MACEPQSRMHVHVAGDAVDIQAFVAFCGDLLVAQALTSVHGHRVTSERWCSSSSTRVQPA